MGPDEIGLFSLIERWRAEATNSGRAIKRVVLAYEAGRDGFWLARCARARGIEAHVIHASSIAVSRDRRRAKTDRLDTALLMRVLLGWLRGEPGHCSMVVIPGLDEEDAKRPTRERENLVGERTRVINRMKAALARLGIRGFNPALRKAVDCLVGLRTPEGAALPARSVAELRRDMARLRFIEDQIAEIEQEREARLEQAPDDKAGGIVRTLTRVVGIGVETADMLTHEVMLRDLRDRRAVARYAGLTGSPHESGARRRERGLSRAGNARVRRGMIQLAWRFLVFQKQSALVQWFRTRTAEVCSSRFKRRVSADPETASVCRDCVVVDAVPPNRSPLGRFPVYQGKIEKYGYALDSSSINWLCRGQGICRLGFLSRGADRDRRLAASTSGTAVRAIPMFGD